MNTTTSSTGTSGTSGTSAVSEWRRRKHRTTSARRAGLEEWLGGRCCRCGLGRWEVGVGEDGEEVRVPTGAILHLHHPIRKDWRSRDLSWSARLARYWRDALAGNLELVCTTCHSDIHTGALPRRSPLTTTCPF